MKKVTTYLVLFISAFGITNSLLAQETVNKPNFQVKYEKFFLGNGLEVAFHIDCTDPVVAVNLTAHVVSVREVTGRTGFAHMFEHFFQHWYVPNNVTLTLAGDFDPVQTKK
jgi:zinc protease